MSFANTLWNRDAGEEISITSIDTPDGQVESPEVLAAYRGFHDSALAVL